MNGGSTNSKKEFSNKMKHFIQVIKNNLVDRIIIDSKTGVSGAGVNPSSTTHYPNIADNVNPYKISSHRHMSEIQQELHGFDDAKVSFTPHLVPVNRGIQTTSHSFLNDENIFMFESLKFNEESHTISGVDAILKGSFMENKKIGKLVLSLALPAVIGAGMATVNAGDVETDNTLKTDEVASTNEVITSTDGVATIVTEEDPIKTDVKISIIILSLVYFLIVCTSTHPGPPWVIMVGERLIN